jgi:hypothetical protein
VLRGKVMCLGQKRIFDFEFLSLFEGSASFKRSRSGGWKSVCAFQRGGTVQTDSQTKGIVGRGCFALDLFFEFVCFNMR